MDEDLTPGDESASTTTDEGPSLIDSLTDALGIEDGETAGASADTAAAGAEAGAGPAAAEPTGAASTPAADGAAETAAAKPNTTEPAKPDPNAELYKPLPETNPRSTHERFQKLVNGHKEEVSKREAAEAERETLRGQIAQYEGALQPLREMGFNDNGAVEDLQQFSQFRRALAAGDAAGALRIMQPILQQLQLATGGALDLNPLTGFPDLAQRVNVGELDQPTAFELARNRHAQSVQEQQHQRQQQAQLQHAQEVQVVRQGAANVDQVVQQLLRDPDYAAVEPALIAQLENIKSNYMPHQWAGEVKRAFDFEKRLLLAQARTATPARTNQPLRASGHSGGAPVPSNAADAAWQSLGLS